MGNCAPSSIDSTDDGLESKNPRLLREFKTALNFLNKFERLNFQYYGDLEEVWKIREKTSKTLFSLHEKRKVELNQNRSYSSHVIKENSILQKLNSPYIINLKYACQDSTSLIMITDPIFSRLSFLLKAQNSFTEDQVQYIIASIILSLEYIHNKNVIHRDLRPESIAFDAYGRIKLTNFLLASIYNSEINNSIDTIGTVGYMAPEVIEKKQYSFGVDYYALGILLYEIATLQKLFGDNTEENLAKMQSLKIHRKELSDKYSTEMLGFLNGLLRFNSKERLGKKGAAQLKRHQWFSSFDWESLANDMMNNTLKKSTIEEQESLKSELLLDDTLRYKRLSSLQNVYLGYQYGFDTSSKQSGKTDTTSFI